MLGTSQWGTTVPRLGAVQRVLSRAFNWGKRVDDAMGSIKVWALIVSGASLLWAVVRSQYGFQQTVFVGLAIVCFILAGVLWWGGRRRASGAASVAVASPGTMPMPKVLQKSVVQVQQEVVPQLMAHSSDVPSSLLDQLDAEIGHGRKISRRWIPSQRVNAECGVSHLPSWRLALGSRPLPVFWTRTLTIVTTSFCSAR